LENTGNMGGRGENFVRKNRRHIGESEKLYAIHQGFLGKLGELE
jgi:hypothetical protein